jgi:sarcosine oxidase, subunit beta
VAAIGGVSFAPMTGRPRGRRGSGAPEVDGVIASDMSDLTADVVVIGAGIVGTSCAYHLAERGRRVIVVEARASPALGSTGRSNACVRAQWRDPTNIAMSWSSIRFYRDFEDVFGSSAGYRPIGYLLLHPPDQWEAHLRAVELQRAAGVPVEVLDVDQARSHAPFVADGIAGATWGPADGRIDPHLATHAFLRSARDHGAELLLNSPVRTLRGESGGWSVSTATATISTAAVVNAAGGWAGEVAALAGLDVPVVHSRRMLFCTGPGQRSDLPMTIDVGSGYFIRSEGDRLIMGFGGGHEQPGYDTTLDWSWLDHVITAGRARFPWILDLPMDRQASWAGTYEITPDHRPFLGRMPGRPGWYNACGFSGHGVMQAPATGRLTAEEIVDGRAHSIDIDPLRIERLAAGPSATTDLVI